MQNAIVKWMAAAAVCCGGAWLYGAEMRAPARMFKHTAADGQIYGALFLKAADLPKGIARRHLILVDTSASQVGEHRLQSLAVLESLLQTLPATDRVRLFAADLRAEPLDEGFQEAHSAGVARSVARLKERIPLGATHLEGVLRAALQAAEDQPTDITYIGDGMSTADLVEIPELRALVADLRQRRIPVHSFCIGAQRDLQLLGVLAQQTGGYVDFDTLIVDANDDQAVKAEKTRSAKLAKDIARARRSAAERAVEQGKGLATALNAPVFFATGLQVAPEGISLLPSDALPVRMDRETVYVVRGSLPHDTRVVLSDAAGETLEWKLAAPVEQPGATFLPVLIGQLEITRGLTNPLAGMPLFLLAQSDFSDNITAMAQRGLQALQQGDMAQAVKISQTVSEADPNNDEGKVLQIAIDRLKTKGAKPARPTPPPASNQPANKPN